MERLYNPDLMPEAEIKATFVAREPLLNELVNLVANQSQGAGVQHVILVAPRGMGKTTLLLMVQFAIADRGLDAQWQSVRFPEESYAITDLADFWLETLRHLSVAIEQPAINEQADALLARYRDPKDLEEAALAQLKQWSRENGKRILLLVDNFDQILEQIRDERDEAALRNVLMNDGTFMLIGAAPAHFHEITNYSNALYNFFKIYNLEDLKFEEILELLRQRAAADNVPDYEEVLRANATKLKVLRYFTGGNPRLILMLYRVVSQSQIGEVREALEKLLDEVTPFYKAKIDSLPPQQRKILDHIARVSAQTNEGLTPGEIADATRISAQSASTQLKRLSDLGYVRAANLRGRNSYYALSEPLYAIWHQMRFGRGPQKRVGWLVNFLKQWYSDEEKPLESARLSGLFFQMMRNSNRHQARSVLEHRSYLALAMDECDLKYDILEEVVSSYLYLEDEESLERLIPILRLDKLSLESFIRLSQIGLVDEDTANEILSSTELSEDINQFKSTITDLDAVHDAVKNDEYEQAIAICKDALSKNLRQFTRTAFLQPLCLSLIKIGYIEEYKHFSQDFIACYRFSDSSFRSLFIVLYENEFFDEALEIIDLAIDLHPENASVWHLKANVLSSLWENEDAIECYKKALSHDESIPQIWADYGSNLIPFRIEEALTALNKALALHAQEGTEPTGLVQWSRFFAYASQGDVDNAREAWSQVTVNTDDESESSSWIEVNSSVFKSLIKKGHAQFVRELIETSPIPNAFDALARALDYLFSGDEALIEKLSPEMRPLVVEIVDKLRPSIEGAAQPATAKRKSKTPPRNRTRKRLK